MSARSIPGIFSNSGARIVYSAPSSQASAIGTPCAYGRGDMLRIETDGGPKPTIRLIGRIHSEHLESLKVQVEDCGALDLAEVTMVDLGAVRFLSRKEFEGCDLLHCAPFIREWIRRERGESLAE